MSSGVLGLCVVWGSYTVMWCLVLWNFYLNILCLFENVRLFQNPWRKNSDCSRVFYSSFILYSFNQEIWQTLSWGPSSLDPWWAECTAAPLIAVTVLRDQSQSIQMLTSPPLRCCNKQEGRNGKRGVKWLVYWPLFSLWHIMKVKVPVV